MWWTRALGRAAELERSGEGVEDWLEKYKSSVWSRNGKIAWPDSCRGPGVVLQPYTGGCPALTLQRMVPVSHGFLFKALCHPLAPRNQRLNLTPRSCNQLWQLRFRLRLPCCLQALLRCPEESALADSFITLGCWHVGGLTRDAGEGCSQNRIVEL